eukprot:CCRYP_004105-RA/>CCRYP_004105-RA protein AED:0.47 eAED:0.47 QI:0/-1/0/1/-1/1/1/0/125
MESMDSRIPKKPKKVGWTEKHCVLCKKHGGPHKSHNTRDCRRYNKDGTPIKKNGGAGKPGLKKENRRALTAQIVRAELKKALRKSLVSARNVALMTRKVTATPATVREGAGRIALGNYVDVRNVN